VIDRLKVPNKVVSCFVPMAGLFLRCGSDCELPSDDVGSATVFVLWSGVVSHPCEPFTIVSSFLQQVVLVASRGVVHQYSRWALRPYRPFPKTTW
jgi:hypothetical protein